MRHALFDTFIMSFIAVLLAMVGGCVSVSPDGTYHSLLKDISAKAKHLKPDGTVVEIEITSNVNEGLVRSAVEGAVRGAKP